MSDNPHSLLNAIPDPPTIRSRLAQLIREQDLLRSLLRVAERKERAAAMTRRQEEVTANA